jgi:hypothetical protein
MGDKPKKKSDFGPVLKSPDFAPEFISGRGIELGQELVGFLRVESAFWAMSPSENVLSFKLEYFPFGHLLLPWSHVHLCVQLHALPMEVPLAPFVFRRIVLPVVNHFDQACLSSDWGYYFRPVCVG